MASWSPPAISTCPSLKRPTPGAQPQVRARTADRKVIRHALARSEGNISNTAKLLGISRPTLYDLLKQYDMHA
jgi:DNA-binding NtrC family response regulator